jgi:hypothetical protein
LASVDACSVAARTCAAEMKTSSAIATTRNPCFRIMVRPPSLSISPVAPCDVPIEGCGDEMNET